MDAGFMNRIARPCNIKKENAARLVSTKVKQGPVIQRSALGDVGNRARTRTFLNAKRILKKSEATTNLAAKIVKPKKENVVQIPAVHQQVKASPEKMEIEEPKTIQAEVSTADNIEIDKLTDAFSSNLVCVEDIDKEDSANPQLVSQYVQDIYNHLWTIEDKYPVDHKYLTGQAITSKMRGVLIDWLIQVHLKFSLLQETLYLTVAILDRFLQAERNVTKERLQLVGVTAMVIASKYEEMYIPDIKDYAFITAGAFSTKDILKMEVYILKSLDFYVSFPLPLHFLRRDSKAGQVDGKQHTLAKYLMELTLPEYSFTAYKSSKVAAAALFISIKLIGDKKDWTDTLTYYSKYTEHDIRVVVCQICALLVRPLNTKQQTIRRKYMTPKYLSISNLPELRPTSKVLQSYASRIVPCAPKSADKT